MKAVESGTTLYIVILGDPVKGFTFHGPYGTEAEAEFDYCQDDEPYTIAPMRYRKGYHVGALSIEVEE